SRFVASNLSRNSGYMSATILSTARVTLRGNGLIALGHRPGSGGSSAALATGSAVRAVRMSRMKSCRPMVAYSAIDAGLVPDPCDLDHSPPACSAGTVHGQ